MEFTFAYKLIKEWDESSVTWLNSDANTLWDSAGGNFDIYTEAKTTYAAEMSWENYDVTEIVKDFVSGTPNNGFIVFPDIKDGNDGRMYPSSEYSAEDSLRPKLTITYENTAINYSNKGIEGIKNIVINKNGSIIKLFIPFENSYRIGFYNASGNTLEVLNGRGKQWHSINSESLSNGIYFIRIFSDKKNLSGKYIHIR